MTAAFLETDNLVILVLSGLLRLLRSICETIASDSGVSPRSVTMNLTFFRGSVMPG